MDYDKKSKRSKNTPHQGDYNRNYGQKSSSNVQFQPCGICKKPFSTEEQKHKFTKEQKAYLKVCSVCKKSFSPKKQEDWVSPESNQYFRTCKICKEMYLTVELQKKEIEKLDKEICHNSNCWARGILNKIGKKSPSRSSTGKLICKNPKCPRPEKCPNRKNKSPPEKAKKDRNQCVKKVCDATCPTPEMCPYHKHRKNSIAKVSQQNKDQKPEPTKEEKKPVVDVSTQTEIAQKKVSQTKSQVDKGKDKKKEKQPRKKSIPQDIEEEDGFLPRATEKE